VIIKSHEHRRHLNRPFCYYPLLIPLYKKSKSEEVIIGCNLATILSVLQHFVSTLQHSANVHKVVAIMRLAITHKLAVISGLMPCVLVVSQSYIPY